MRLVVIDGYNVIGAMQRFGLLSEEDLDSVRARLVADVAAFVGPGDRAVVVFDGGQNPASDGASHTVAGVTVVFSAYGRDADTVIEEIVAKERTGGVRILLVSSDQTLQWTTMGANVTRMSSAEFARELAEEGVERDEYARDGSGVALDRHLDPDTRAKLARWARGLRPEEDRS